MIHIRQPNRNARRQFVIGIGDLKHTAKRPARRVDARITQEAHFVLEMMRRDLGGFLPGKETEEKDENKLVGRLATSSKQFMLCFDDDKADGEPAWGKPDTVIVYEARDEQLLRIEQTDKGKFTVVASHITDFTPTQLAKGVRVDFTVTYEDVSKTYTLISQDP